MDMEKFPNYFLFTIVLYGLLFITAFSFFIVPSLSFGFAYTDFYLLSILLFLPLLLLAVYARISRFQFLWGKEKIFRLAILALTLVNLFMVMYMMILLV